MADRTVAFLGGGRMGEALVSGLIRSHVVPSSVVRKTWFPVWYRTFGSCGEWTVGAVHCTRYLTSRAPSPALDSGQTMMFRACPVRRSKRVRMPW